MAAPSAARGFGASALVTFDGRQLPEEARGLLRDHDVAGVSLARHRNAGPPERVGALTDAIQTAGGTDGLPRLVAADQECGQLMALGEGFTPFAGNMALGATDDADLAYRVAAAIGRELSAVGVNLNYAPVCDLATSAGNPALGTRAFGDDPARVGRLVAATVRGLQGEGVAATAKHFPGTGDADADPHLDLPALPHGLLRLDAVEIEPFRAAIEAGVSAVMVSHVAAPAVTGRADLPSSLSRTMVADMLRRGLDFEGVVLTDAMDMGAVGQGLDRVVEAVAALRAGGDLLLLWDKVEDERLLLDALARAHSRDVFDRAELASSRDRVAGLRRRLALRARPGFEVVGCAEHRSLARELAVRSVTLVRDEAGTLPIRDGARVAAIVVRPADLTPADTSSTVDVELAEAIRDRRHAVDAFVTEHPPTAEEIAGIRERVREHDVVVVGTLDASRDPRQAALVAALHESGPPVVWVALRSPWDLSAYPQASTYACTYGIHRPSMDALAAALSGDASFLGSLPVDLCTQYARGHGLDGTGDRART
ncbi:MAG: glycoside hydrolase family 3 protein [Candidatus Rokuibacteriota bacterium]